MESNFYDLMKYAHTGLATADMTAFDKLRAQEMAGGKVKTLTGVPPLTFKANGKPLISWSMLGNSQQTGTPAPDNPIYPEFVGEKAANLFNGNLTVGYFSGANFEVSAVERFRSIRLHLKNGKYTFSFEHPVRLVRVIVDNTYFVDVATNITEYIITITDDNYDIGISFRDEREQTSWDDSPIMLNSGSTPLPYEPYGYKLPITNAGQTTPIYLGQTQTLRRIKKLVLTGEEVISGVHESSTAGVYCASMRYSNCGATDIIDCNKPMANITYPYFVCSHLKMKKAPSSDDMWYDISEGEIGANSYSPDASTKYYNLYFIFCIPGCTTIQDFQNYFTAQYASGTPVTIWYVLAEPTTAIVNEPLSKIGDYADELDSTDAGVSIPTVRGSNTLTVGTDLQPSSMTITYR